MSLTARRAFKGIRSAKAASSKSRLASKGQALLGTSSRKKLLNGAKSKGPLSKKSKGPVFRPVTIKHSRVNADGASAVPAGVDVKPQTELPDKLYGVKVSNFENQLKNVHIHSFLTERFMLYGNVFCVTVHGADKARYALVFYKERHEQEKALAADTNGPLGLKLNVTLWSGPPPSIFGIVVTKIDNDVKDLPDRIKSEFGTFGEITLVNISGPTQQQFALVFYTNRKDQEKALASPNPIKTSFGDVTVTAWNKPPPTWIELPAHVTPSTQTQTAPTKNLIPPLPSSRSQACPKIPDKRNSHITPLMSINISNRNVERASTMSTGVVQPTTLSSGDLPGSLYGVKVSNFETYLQNVDIKSFLTEGFMVYGNVVCVTMHGSGKDRYGLVFYEQKLEREKALTADLKGPHGMKLCIALWSGLSPYIFGIAITNIDDYKGDISGRVKAEFDVFGEITLAQMRGSADQRFALVFYKYRKGQEKALASPNPFQTSFGKVTITAWNKPPPSWREMSCEDIFKEITCSPIISIPASQNKSSQQPPASVRNEPPVATPSPVWNRPPRATPPNVRNGTPVAIPTPVWNRPPKAIPPNVRNGPSVAKPSPEWNRPPRATPPNVWNGPSVAKPPPEWNRPPRATPPNVRNGPSVAIRPRPRSHSIETKYEHSKSLHSSLVRCHSPHTVCRHRCHSPHTVSRHRCHSPHTVSRHNRSRSPLFSSARIKSRHSRSRSPCYMSKNRSPTRTTYSRCQSPQYNRSISKSPHTRTRYSRSISKSPHTRTWYSRSISKSPHTRTWYSRSISKSPHSRARYSRSISKSPHIRARYSRSRSPCSSQLHSERWHTEEKVSAQSRPPGEHKRAGHGEVSSSLQKSSLILWINNLDDAISRAELHAAFNPFGEIEHIEIKEGFRNNGKQAFLQYCSPSSVTRAIDQMDGTYFYNRKLQVDFAYPQQATNCLWVYGLQFADATEQYLTYVFKQFGQVQTILHDPVKGAALVLYSDVTSAVKAMTMKNIGGHPVSLGYANHRCQLGFCHSMESSGQNVGAFDKMLG